MLQEYVDRLCKELDIAPTPLVNEQKNCTLEITEDVSVFLQATEEHFLIRSVLCESPKENKEDMFSYIMKGNLLGDGTGDNAIGLDEKEKFLTLSTLLSYESNYTEFRDHLEDFVNYLIYWREEIIKKENELQAKLF